MLQEYIVMFNVDEKLGFKKKKIMIKCNYHKCNNLITLMNKIGNVQRDNNMINGFYFFLTMCFKK